MIDLKHGDCLEVMPTIPGKSIDMILCDLPYGTTACKWDTIIPFEPLWEQYNRIIKDNGVIVLTASQPFTSALVMSNVKLFKHNWVWNKKRGVGHLLAKKRPMMCTEDIIVFYRDLNERKSQITSFISLRKYFEYIFKELNITKKQMLKDIGQRVDHCFRFKSTQWDLPTEETYNDLIEKYKIDKLVIFKKYVILLEEYKKEELKFKNNTYNPQMRDRKNPRKSSMKKSTDTCYGDLSEYSGDTLHKKYPINLITFDKSSHKDMLFHPTQKPILLLEYLIKTYTNENETVLDNCMGSGSTGVACVNNNRKFIGIERELNYFKISQDRIEKAVQDKKEELF